MGTYHAAPLLPEARRLGWEVVQLVPDRSGIKPGDPVPVATPDEIPQADLLVVTGAGDWPADCAARLRHLPLVASSLAYQLPVEAPRAKEFAGAAAGDHRVVARRGEGVRRLPGRPPPRSRSWVRHRPTTCPSTTPEEGAWSLVLTSVTKSSGTGGSAPAPGACCSPRPNASRRPASTSWSGCTRARTSSLWERYEISAVPSVQASARAEAAIGIPGTVFPVVAAVGVPLVGCTDPRLQIPDYLLSVCTHTITTADDAVTAVETPSRSRRRCSMRRSVRWVARPGGCSRCGGRPVCGPARQQPDVGPRRAMARRPPVSDGQSVGCDRRPVGSRFTRRAP